MNLYRRSTGSMTQIFVWSAALQTQPRPERCFQCSQNWPKPSHVSSLAQFQSSRDSSTVLDTRGSSLVHSTLLETPAKFSRVSPPYPVPKSSGFLETQPKPGVCLQQPSSRNPSRVSGRPGTRSREPDWRHGSGFGWVSRTLEHSYRRLWNWARLETRLGFCLGVEDSRGLCKARVRAESRGLST